MPTSEFLELMFSDSLYPMISRPTRVTSASATIIDNIYCNSLQKEQFNGILYADISDHFPIFCIDFTNHHKSLPQFNVIKSYSQQIYRNLMKDCLMSIGLFHLIVAMPKKHLRHFINCIWTCIMHVLDNLQKSQTLAYRCCKKFHQIEK